ncbi:MAG: PAS domain S-box protein [Chlorobi bacterium]|nr:PAS domain S-box protein [Chlorobiota bacterium]
MESEDYSNKFKELTSQLTKDILSFAGDPAKAIPKTLKEIKDITKAGIVALYRCNENFSGTKHVGHTLIGQIPEEDNELFDKELFDYLTQTIHSRKTVVTVSGDLCPEVQERLSKTGFRNSLLLPMQIENTIIGGFIILGLPSTDKLGPIIAGLKTLSGIFALTFRYSMLYTETRKQVNKKAEEKIQRFSRIIEDSLNEIYLFDAESLKFVQVNNAAQKNLGFTMDELKLLTPLSIKPDLTLKSFTELINPLRKGEKNKVVFETTHKRKDKSLYEVEVHLQLLRFESQDLFAAIIMDITDRKKAENFNSKLISAMQDGFSVIDKDGTQLDVNPALVEMTGFPREELIGASPPHPYWLPGEYDKIEAAYKKTPKASLTDFELTFVRKNGERFPVTVSPSKVTDNKGGTISYFATVKDITRRKQTEEELKKYREKLEQLVKERTKELELKNEELNNAMKVFVGRELKIKELQNKLNTLDK